MANVVEYVLKITGGKSPETIKKLSKQLKGTLKELKGLGKQSAKSFNEFRKNSRKASEAVKGLQGAFTKLSIGIGGTAAAFVGMNKVIADSVNEIVDASTRSGIATDTLAGLRLAAEGSGKSFSDLERGLDNFTKKIIDANKDTSQSAKEFLALGISVKDANGNLRSSNDVFNETIKRLSRVEDATQKNAIAMKLFGRSGRALIQSGALESLDDFVGKAKELGIALDEEGVQKAAEFQRGMADLKIASLGALQSIAEGLTGEKGLGPSLSILAEDLSNFGGGMKIFLEGMRNAFGGLKIFLIDVKKLILDIQGLLPTIESFKELIFGVTPEFAKKAGLSDAEVRAFQQLGMGKDAPERKGIFDRGFLDTSKSEKNIKRLIGVIANLTKTKKPLAELVEISKNPLAFENQDDAKELLGFIGELEKSGKITFQGLADSILNYRNQSSKTKEALKKVNAEQEKLRLEREKLKKDLDKPITIDLSALGGGKGKGEDKPDPSTGFSDFQKKLFQDIKKTTKEIQKQEKAISKAQDSFLDLKKRIESIGEIERPFQDVIDDLDETKNRFKELGQSTLPVLKLKMQVISLRREVEKLATTKTAINITTDIIGIAGGDILGGITGILQKTLKGSALELLGPVSGAIGGLVAFGQSMQQAADQAIEEREAKLGRKLTEEERAKVSDAAMRRKAEQDVKQFAMALEVGIKMLPPILLEVLPPLFIDLGVSIVKAILELPFRIGKAIIRGLFNTGAKVADAPLNIMKGLSDFFGLDSKRSGGRMISARRGLRFTGSSDTMAQLHRNEFVVPESGARPQAVERIMNQQSGSGINITINADVVERDAVEELVRKIERRFQNFGTMQSTLFGA